jgi:hypothetical protein
MCFPPWRWCDIKPFWLFKSVDWADPRGVNRAFWQCEAPLPVYGDKQTI